MLSPLQQSEFEAVFPFMQRAGAEFKKVFYEIAQYAELPAGVSIGDEGQQCSQLAMVLDGVGRVFKLSSSGREVTLYRIYSGESCVLTASCIMNHGMFPAMAVTETSVRAIVIPQGSVRQWFCGEPQWQQFIFGLLSHRLASIISVVEEVAFKRIDVRLAQQFSRAIARGEPIILKTHAELAADVGSSREVVSRILRDLAHRGLIQSSRGHIEVLDAAALEQLAAQ